MGSSPEKLSIIKNWIFHPKKLESGVGRDLNPWVQASHLIFFNSFKIFQIEDNFEQIQDYPLK